MDFYPWGDNGRGLHGNDHCTRVVVAMSPAAMQAIRQAYSILKMDASPARLQWMRKVDGEADCVLFKRRRAWLLQAGSGLYLCDRDWDELPKVARDKLAGCV